ncbi:pyrroline-5-carboxylate reductase [Priestia flexa]|uniref:pyrroline-5-carboxylate reductase n=1 Tax=Priestia flexa TaxID=86664 RepID=UPI00099BFEE8|nr:pyrroline-5-carboxylate reductase [Priestia flexa]AQX55151.1 pyrroline-5-carboxylate reductase [Priestia flexa]MBY6087613.1 pyrroline-5-carboxylate reductase [Priestia flexa]
MTNQKVLFIGAGRMAEAIAAGLIHTNASMNERIVMTNQRDKKRLAELKEKYVVDVTQDWEAEVKNATTIVLAMPPEVHDEVLEKLSKLVTNQFVITVAAGIGPSYLEERLPAHTAVAWIMPNTAATIGESISLYAVGSSLSESHKQALTVILNSIGSSQLCTEDEVRYLTAITGSAPAFVAYFSEALIDSAMSYGVSKEIAQKLVVQMMSGSANLIKHAANPSAVRKQVTTPGGATAEGLKVMEQHRFKEMIHRAVDATNSKANGSIKGVKRERLRHK